MVQRHEARHSYGSRSTCRAPVFGHGQDCTCGTAVAPFTVESLTRGEAIHNNTSGDLVGSRLGSKRLLSKSASWPLSAQRDAGLPPLTVTAQQSSPIDCTAHPVRIQSTQPSGKDFPKFQQACPASLGLHQRLWL